MAWYDNILWSLSRPGRLQGHFPPHSSLGTLAFRSAVVAVKESWRQEPGARKNRTAGRELGQDDDDDKGAGFRSCRNPSYTTGSRTPQCTAVGQTTAPLQQIRSASREAYPVPSLKHITHRAGDHNSARLSRRALEITDTELNVIAALAIIGLSTSPKNGYSRPAATGTPMAL